MGNKPEEMLALIGSNKRTAVIMNARDYIRPDERSDRLQIEFENLTRLGLQPEELDLRDFFNNSSELKAVVKNFGFFWVMGGNTFLLRKAFKQSGFDGLIIELLTNDVVAYGGYSAGICVLAPSLRGLDLVDSKDSEVEGYIRDVIWDGLGLIEYAIVPHFKCAQTELDDIDTYVQYLIDNHILFKALRDGEAIVINGSEDKIVA